MSRKNISDSPWQNGVPPFGLCQQPFNPLMNCGPMWAQNCMPGLPGNMMAQNMMRFGINAGISNTATNFKRDQDNRNRQKRKWTDNQNNYRNKVPRSSSSGGDRNKTRDRSKSPTSKGASRSLSPKRDSSKNVEKEKTTKEEEEGKEKEKGSSEDLYDPAEPTGDNSENAKKEESENKDDTETEKEVPKTKAQTCHVCKMDFPDAEKFAEHMDSKGHKAKMEEKVHLIEAHLKASEIIKKSEKKEESPKKGPQKGKGWCTVCEINFEGSFLDHRRTEDHKTKRDQKYPKCQPCSMGFANKFQYEQHCIGDFHRKNVEAQNNQIEEGQKPVGEEFLEEITAYYCKLCELIMKENLKEMHCKTNGHIQRINEIKKKEEEAEAATKAREVEEEKKQQEQNSKTEENENSQEPMETLEDRIKKEPEESQADATSNDQETKDSSAKEAKDSLAKETGDSSAKETEQKPITVKVEKVEETAEEAENSADATEAVVKAEEEEEEGEEADEEVSSKRTTRASRSRSRGRGRKR